MDLRPYQFEAIDAVNEYLATRDTHGVVSIPTAGGKTIIFAAMIRDWLKAWPGSRVVMLAHRQELVGQAEDKLRRIWPGAPIGVWSSGLKRREGDRDILIAGIQSVYKRACDFEPFDVIIVDEAHLVPNTNDTMYRRFLAEAALVNPRVRYLGFTATPYRLDGGPLCGRGKLFDDVIYEADIKGLIADGYLCTLRTKKTATELDAAGVRVRKGDFVPGELEQRVNTEPLVAGAVSEIVDRGRDRRAWLIFCSGVAHAWSVSRELARRGVKAPVIIGETDKEMRARTLADFDAGHVRAVVNVNCLTEGLDVTRIDLIAVLRPTQSTALWVQMVGRGFRLHPGKADTLVLDFGGNARRHGPLDALRIKTKGAGEGGEPPVKVCPRCEELVAAAAALCPACEYRFPPRELKHDARADVAPLLTPSEPWEVDVVSARVQKHQKQGKPPSLQVTYYGNPVGEPAGDLDVTGSESHREWVCLEHDGYAKTKAQEWWHRRFGHPIPATVDEAIASDLFLGQTLTRITQRIRVKQVGKYTEVVGATLSLDQPAVVRR